MTFGNGKIQVPDQSLFPRHIHNEYEVFYFCEGDADYVVGSALYHMNHRDLLVIRPGDYHYLRLRSNAPYERFYVHFTKEELGLPTETVLESGMFHIARDSLIHRFFQTWAESGAELPEEELEAFVRAGVAMLLLLLKHQLQQQILPAEENPVLKQVLQYIDLHPEQAITAEQLADRFFVSTSWVVHIFRRYLGISLMQYIRRKRILYAQSLILAGSSPTEAAMQCQFENYATFFRQYKAVLGHGPNADKQIKKDK